MKIYASPEKTDIVIHILRISCIIYDKHKLAVSKFGTNKGAILHTHQFNILFEINNLIRSLAAEKMLYINNKIDHF